MKRINVLITLLLVLSSTNVIAWDWQTHQNVVERVYNSLPRDLNLSLEYLKEGSILPDKVFHDNRLHNYPPSLELTNIWMSVAKEEYKNKNFRNASLAFGIASHYITDSFAAPHYIKGETSYQHSKYEDRGYLELNEYCRVDINISEGLPKGPEEGKLWNEWLQTNNDKIPETAANKATKIVYSAAFETFNTGCDKKTRIIIKKPSLTITIISSLAVLLLIILLIKKKKSKHS
ncbi:MAG TPA: zinc dependent phospholipase C family protein [Candidatus Nanoarchaeia archaeon]|nr:zinc dependent phospholipase C family protein [Candidatus Nanoarchaeia archaeon]